MTAEDHTGFQSYQPEALRLSWTQTKLDGGSYRRKNLIFIQSSPGTVDEFVLISVDHPPEGLVCCVF